MSDDPKDTPHPKFSHLTLSTSGPIDCSLVGNALLNSPYLNKGSAFTEEERRTFDLIGLLPNDVQTLEEQRGRAYKQYKSRPEDILKNTFMASMKSQNLVLFYALLHEHLAEMFPIIYTPTEGDAIANYSRIFRRPEGCFLDISKPESDIDIALKRWGEPDDIDVIVVSDAEQILGIGDQGVGGVLISVAKLVLYTACAGVHPHRTLPVILDCGTDNQELLNDDLYLGSRHQRVRGEKYDAFVESFMKKARHYYPKAYIHCEDFGVRHARRILDRYRDKIPIFNDDVQGTGCVATAAIMSALRICNLTMKEVRVLTFGAGSAGTGISDQIARAISIQSGKSLDEARQHIWLIDKQGILTTDMDDLSSAQKPYAVQANAFSAGDDGALIAAIKAHKPHVLIGTSTVPSSFTQSVIATMSQYVARPVVLPLSNPTRLHEAKPEDVIKWSSGAALVATGSPFPKVEYDGKTFEISEANNSAVFPGIGLGCILCRARLVTDRMLVAATQAVASCAPISQDEEESGNASNFIPGLLPPVETGDGVREVSMRVAVAVIKAAVKEGVATEPEIPSDDSELQEWVKEQMWEARYSPLRKVDQETADKLGRGEAGSQRLGADRFQ